MKLNFSPMSVPVVVGLSLLTGSVIAAPITFGTASPFAVLGQAGVTNTGSSMIFGSVAGSTGTPAVTGFTFSTSPGPGKVLPPGVGFTMGVANAGPGTPFGDATTAYNAAQAASGAIDFSGSSTLGSGGAHGTLAPGVYFFSSTAALNGMLTLDAGGNNAAMWIFQIGSALTTASASSVVLTNTGAPGPFSGSVIWAVGSAATLGTTTTFLGSIVSQAGSVLNTGATIGCGRVISLQASVTLDTNTIVTPSGCVVGSVGTATPEPGASTLLSFGLVAMLILAFRKRAKDWLTSTQA